MSVVTKVVVPPAVDCYDVFRWPEFRALVDRLGLPHVGVTALRVDLPGEGHFATFTVTFNAADAGPAVPKMLFVMDEADEPVVST